MGEKRDKDKKTAQPTGRNPKGFAEFIYNSSLV
jgi:hypothetical protein